MCYYVVIICIELDHFEVYQYLEKIPPNTLKFLGIALGLRIAKIQRMKDIHFEMVCAWINREDEVLEKCGEPSWMGLVCALKKIGQTGIAEDIKKEKCPEENEHPKGNSLSLTPPPKSSYHEDLHQRIHADVNRLRLKFANLQSTVRHKVKDHKELAAHVIGMYILGPHDEEKVTQAVCTNEIFNVLSKYWSLIDFSNLESITQNEEVCGNVKQEMEAYKAEVERFCERRVSEVPPDVLKNNTDQENMEKLVITLDLNDAPLKNIKYLKEKIANILCKRASDLLLYDVGKGSVLVTLLLLGKNAFVKLPLTADQITTFKEEHVVVLIFR